MLSSLRDMADAYILATVLAYSAANQTNFSCCVVFAVLAAAVLLINSHYLHAPIHVPSTLLAILVLFLPLYNENAALAFASLTRAFWRTPYFLAELIVGFVLIGWFLRLAILRPYLNQRNSRRAITPISLQPVPSMAHVAQPTEPSTQSAQSPDQPTASIEAQMAQPSTAEHSQPRVVTPEQARATALATLQPHASTAAAAARAALQPTPAANRAEVRAGSESRGVRRRRPPTQSQLIAVKIMEQKKEEERKRREALERKQMEMREKSEALRAEKEEREAARRHLQEGVRGAARGVGEAKEKLAKALIEADQGRMERRRAADQFALVRSEENERALDEACKESARLETAEQIALNEVNAAQARWVDMQNRLNHFDRR